MCKEFQIQFDGKEWIVEGIDIKEAMQYLDAMSMEETLEGQLQEAVSLILDEEWVYYFVLEDKECLFLVAKHARTGVECKEFEADMVRAAFDIKLKTE